MIITGATYHGSHIEVAVAVTLQSLADNDGPYLVRFDLDWEGDFYGRRIPQDIPPAERELIVAWSREVMRTSTPDQLMTTARETRLTKRGTQPRLEGMTS